MDCLMSGLGPERRRVSLRRFPNPVPAGVNVPHWALVAISVRFLLWRLSQIKPNLYPLSIG
jgi:hypothetical protein